MKPLISAQWFRAYRKNYDLFLLFLPVIAYYVVFHYLPMYGVLIAFKDYNIMLGFSASQWVGLKHFQKFMASPSFMQVMGNTVIISGLKLILGIPMPILLALLIDELPGVRFKRMVQTVSYLPHFLGWVVLSGMFVQFLSPRDGFINEIIKLFGGKPVFFMGDVKWFRSTLVITHVWREMGWGSIIYLAAIAGINPELYEASVMDGAGRARQVWHITLPGIIPVIIINLILNSGNIINAGFDQVFNMYNDAVMPVADIIDTYVYRMGIISMNFGFAAAVGLFKMLISFAMLMVVNTIARRVSDYGIW